MVNQTDAELTAKALEKLEQLIKNNKVFIDTCSLLYEEADRFWENVSPILEQEKVKIIIPQRVVDEIQKKKEDSNQRIADTAQKAEKTIFFLKRQNS